MQFSQDARLTDCLRTHVLGWHSFAYSADPRRSSLQDAATEVRESCLTESDALNFQSSYNTLNIENSIRFYALIDDTKNALTEGKYILGEKIGNMDET